MPGIRKKAHSVALLGIFLALVLVCGLIERMIPLDFAVPGVRLGLSNVILLLAIYCFRFRAALCLAVMKCLLLAVFTGGFSALLYSLCGTLASFLVMWVLQAVFTERISPVGVSVVGAVCHVTGQLLAASLLLETMHVFVFMPLLVLLSGLTGTGVGLTVRLALPLVGKR